MALHATFGPVSPRLNATLTSDTPPSDRRILGLWENTDGEYHYDPETSIATVHHRDANELETGAELMKSLQKQGIGYELAAFSGETRGFLYSWRPELRENLIRFLDQNEGTYLTRLLVRAFVTQSNSYQLLNDYYTAQLVPLSVGKKRPLTAAEKSRYIQLGTILHPYVHEASLKRITPAATNPRDTRNTQRDNEPGKRERDRRPRNAQRQERHQRAPHAPRRADHGGDSSEPGPRPATRPTATSRPAGTPERQPPRRPAPQRRTDSRVGSHAPTDR